MKIFLFASVAVFFGCIQKNNNSIEGIYTRKSTGEFSRAFDTLIVFDFDKTTGTYLIRRKTGFTRYKEGVPQPKEWHWEKMITEWDESTNQLVDRKTGRLFSFKDGMLLFGTAVYKKVGS